MSVELRKVAADEAEIRLDRWFKRHFPELGHGRLEKLLRTGQIRVDGARAKASDRLASGQTIRVPPLGLTSTADAEPQAKRGPKVPEEMLTALQKAVLYRDDMMLVIDKPAGLATQGGTGIDVHIDLLLDALRFDATERPRLVHRLDKDTSGVLVLARSAKAAQVLAEAFRTKSTLKVYWALTVGVPNPRDGRIDLALSKEPGRGGERMQPDPEEGKRAITDYVVLETAGRRAAWVALQPITGRTHQLRAHCAALGTPIVGDGKYGGAEAFLTGAVSRKLHLHARAIAMPRSDGGLVRVTAPLPRHIRDTFRLLEFREADHKDPFAPFAGD